MNVTQEIIASIEQACSQHQKLNIHQTLRIITAYRAISNDPELIDKVIHLIRLYSKQEHYSKTLSPRQNQIFNLIGLDFSSKEIADMLAISEATVSTHRKNIIKKLQISGAGTLQKIAYQYLHKKEEK
ncbi:LuxR C-terminal-related transcriptional regulator [uncultured Dokdonia sp.]|uniref:response regulator transcription factor n=1 Tax=uncultured Dokdonia sp. TaxID=575653 RepID=UPI002611335B|nr:LuxR C-terminal-related transcriptional regulator [uncultured Dokdonia sp.]